MPQEMVEGLNLFPVQHKKRAMPAFYVMIHGSACFLVKKPQPFFL